MSELAEVNSLDETAAYLRIGVGPLVRLARLGKIGSLKQGRTLTFPKESIEAYVLANTTSATPPNPHGLTDRGMKRVRSSHVGSPEASAPVGGVVQSPQTPKGARPK